MSQIVPVEQRVAAMRETVQRVQVELEKALPDFMRGQSERFMQIAVDAAIHPDIVGSEPLSVVAAVMKAAQCGVPLDKVHGALVPFREHGVAKAQFIPMFQGLIVAAMRNGDVKSIWSNVVYEGDDFEEERGTEPKLRHRPKLGNRQIEKALGAYCCAKLTSGEVIFEFMDKEQILAVKRTSKASKGPWANKEQEPEMWRKTTVRRLAKYMPKSPDFQRLLEADDEFEPLEPRTAEYEPVSTPAPQESKPSNGTAAKVNGAAITPEVVPPVRWFREIEIQLTEPAEKWIDQVVTDKGVLAGVTYRQAVESNDEKVRAEVERVIGVGAQLQQDKGAAPRPYQKLAEALRLKVAAGPLGTIESEETL